jgi:hypothetical protein
MWDIQGGKIGTIPSYCNQDLNDKKSERDPEEKYYSLKNVNDDSKVECE